MGNVSHVGAGFECRLCGTNECHVLLDMGELPLANDFVRSADDNFDRELHPVVFVMCAQCRLLQLRELVSPSRMFSNYVWTSSSSAAAREYAGHFAEDLVARLSPVKYPFVVELASNDGLVLRQLAQVGYRVLGVEPSTIADEATAAGIPTLRAFFSAEVAAEVVETHGHADIVVARNVIGHVADLRSFLAGINKLVRPEGVVIIESPYALGLRHDLQYDYIFHEHVCYFTVTTLVSALTRFGMAPRKVTFTPMNGGSFLCESRRVDNPDDEDDALQPTLALERVLELNDPESWSWYSQAVAEQREHLRVLLTDLAGKGAAVAAYGAAAKTMTMFNYCQIGPEMVSAIGDGSPRKQGLLCPGVRIPVVSPDDLVSMKPDYVLIGPWNFSKEIVGQLRAIGYNGKFISPLPMPRVL